MLGTDANWLRQYRVALITDKGKSAKPIAASFEYVKTPNYTNRRKAGEVKGHSQEKFFGLEKSSYCEGNAYTNRKARCSTAPYYTDRRKAAEVKGYS